jgi:hypothetical protein
LFFDELSNAPISVQAVLYRVILERNINGLPLGDQVVMIAAGNRQADKAAAGRISTALASRFASHVEIEVDLHDWCSWALDHGVREEVVGFVRFRPAMLHDFNPSKNTELAFPCPRTWEFCSKLLDAGIPAGAEHDTICGCIGSGAAGEFLAFLEVYRTMPNPDAILLDPDGVDVPENLATLYAICGALARRASLSTFGAITKYGDRMAPEFQVMLVKDSIQHCRDIQSTSAFLRWCEKNKSVFL